MHPLETISYLRGVRLGAAGDTAVHKIPATALAARLAPAWAVASSPNAEPRRLAEARAAMAADSAVVCLLLVVQPAAQV